MAARKPLQRFLPHVPLCMPPRDISQLDLLLNIFKSSYRNLSSAAAVQYHPQSFGPSVRLLLTRYDIKSELVVPTGPHERLLKGDVLSYINRNGLQPKPFNLIIDQTGIDEEIRLPDLPSTPPPVQARRSIPEVDGDFCDIDLTGMRRTIAKRITHSKTTIPHVYTSVECKINQLSKTRKQLSEEGIKVSVNDMIVKACAVVLRRIPEVNCVWDDGDIKPLSQVDVAVAVATDSGLITPIVKCADEKSITEISSDIRELAGRAKEGKLQPHEIVGGSFTVSNLGMFGVTEFKAVVNPPQSSIIAVGNLQLTLNEDGNPDTYINITLSCDGRIVDDVLASKFITAIKDLIENPSAIAL